MPLEPGVALVRGLLATAVLAGLLGAGLLALAGALDVEPLIRDLGESGDRVNVAWAGGAGFVTTAALLLACCSTGVSLVDSFGSRVSGALAWVVLPAGVLAGLGVAVLHLAGVPAHTTGPLGGGVVIGVVGSVAFLLLRGNPEEEPVGWNPVTGAPAIGRRWGSA